MGHGVAYLLARRGHQVRVQDTNAAIVANLPLRLGELQSLLQDDELPGQVHGTTDLAVAVEGVDFVIEAATENLDLKRQIFRQLEKHAPADAVLATNTSALPIGRITEGLATADRVVGAHFWNPPYLVRLVEIVLMSDANHPAAEKMAELLRDAGQHPVFVTKDIPGFIGNRLQHALKREAIALVAAGVCDAETLDDVVKHGFGARLAVLGPLEQSDLVGLDLTKAIHDTLMPDLDRTAHTHPYLAALVANGDLGMKTGKGFRKWTLAEAAKVRERLNAFLLSIALQSRRGK